PNLWTSKVLPRWERIYRGDIDRLDYNKNFTILDAGDQLTAMKQVLRNLNIDPKKFDPRAMLGQVSTAKNELVTPEAYNERVGNFFERQVGQIYEAYQKMLRKNQD